MNFTFFLPGFKEGYITKDNGAQIIIAKCKNVTEKVSIRQTSDCFNHLAIWYGKYESYRNVKSATTEEDAAEIECSEAPVHKIGSRFFLQNPDFHEVPPPQKLMPDGTKNRSDTFHAYLDLNSLSKDKMNDAIIQVVTAQQHENTKEMIDKSMEVAVEGTNDEKVDHWSKKIFNKVWDGAQGLYEKVMKNVEDFLIYFSMLLGGIFVFMYGLGCLKQLVKGNWLKLFKVMFSPFLVLLKWAQFWAREFDIIKDVTKKMKKVKKLKMKNLKKKTKKTNKDRKKNKKKKLKQSDSESENEESYENLGYDDRL